MGTSVLVITHRKGEALFRCLQSVLKLQRKEVVDEVIVVDDGGDDRPIVERFSDPRLVYAVARHRGYRLATLLNAGDSLCRHDVILRLDGDCIPHLGWAEAGLMAVEAGDHPLVAGRIDWVHSDGWVNQDSRLADGSHDRLAWGGNLAYRREDIEAVGGWNEAYNGAWGCEDDDLESRWRAVFGHGADYEPRMAVSHQFHERNRDRTVNEALLAMNCTRYGYGDLATTRTEVRQLLASGELVVK